MVGEIKTKESEDYENKNNHCCDGSKITGHVCKLMGRQGVTWAGKIALKICPDILEELSSQVREKIFVVCGTNGKTTTNNMLCAGLEAEGKKSSATIPVPTC